MATTPRSGGPARSRPAAPSSRHSCCAQARSSLGRKRPQKAPSRHQISTPPAFNPTEPDRDYRLAIDELDAIAGGLARETADRGGSWGDIGGALQLRPATAHRAYGR